jgi:hypothetical protein
MKSMIRVIVVGMLTVLAPFAISTRAEGSEAPQVPTFEGFLTIGTDTRFTLALLGPDGKPASQSWVKVGQTFGGYEVVSFDTNAETLKVRKPGGAEIEIKLVNDSKVVDSGPPLVRSRDEARRFAMDRVVSFLKAVREEHRDRVVRINPDVALMPEDRRRRFLEQREKLTANGQYLTPFLLPDGRWGEAISGDEANRLPPQVRAMLSAADRREINAAWALARAEAIALGVPPKR